MRACSPPWFSIRLSTIHEVAEPLAINTISLRRAAQPFQKFSNAATKLDFCVSIQGISSINTTFFLLVSSDSRYSSRASNASNQSANLSDFMPENFFNARAKLVSCRWRDRLCPPTNVKSYCPWQYWSTRKVLPTLRRPYTITNSERSDSITLWSS